MSLFVINAVNPLIYSQPFSKKRMGCIRFARIAEAKLHGKYYPRGCSSAREECPISILPAARQTQARGAAAK
jgi:hypothetical protein